MRERNERDNDDLVRRGPRIWHLLVALLAVWVFYSLADMALTPQSMPYTDFKRELAAGEISEVRISDQTLIGRWKTPQRAQQQPNGFLVFRVDDPALLADLTEKGVRVIGVPESTTWQQVFTWGIPLAILLLVLGGVGRSFGGIRSGLATAGRSKPRMYMEKDIPVRFTDVAGVDEAKEELKEVLEFLKTPEKFARVGGKMPRGILLVGPPGTGKTLLARAVAGEAAVPFFSISGSEFVEMFVGVGAARVRDLFEQARAKAPCIIFIDELDALGKVRGVGPGANEEREQTLNQLLVELDGFDPRSGVVLMAATNRPEILDPALLRAGRFDRHVVVDRPDRPGRLAILKVHARSVPLKDETALEDIAAMTAGMVGADLANIVNEAALQSVRSGHEKVERADLEEAVERVIAGLSRKSRALSTEEKRRVAWHEVGHAIVGIQVGGTELKKISILPRGVSALGYTIQLPTQDRFLMTQPELESRIAALLGGRAAEALVFNELSTGAQDDLQKATAIARAMVRSYGMSEALGPISLQDEPQPLFLGVRGNGHTELSDSVTREVDEETRRILEAQFQRASTILSTRLAALDAGARALLERETISGEELVMIMKRFPEVEAEAPSLAS